MNNSFENLKTFFASRFHQDWVEEASTDTEIVQSFRREATAEEVAVVRQELGDFISLPLSDERLHKLLESEFYCYYHIKEPNQTRIWLRSIQRALQGD